LKRENLAFLLAGLAFGFLVGFGVFKSYATRPVTHAESEGTAIPSVAGPAAPTSPMGASPQAGGGAPMMAEMNALRERVTKDPKDTAAWTRLGNLFQDAGMFERAIEMYGRVLALTPADANVLTDAGICHRELKDFDKALASFEKAQTVDPANWQSLYNIAVVAGLDLRKFDRADAALARLDQARPGDPDVTALRQALETARSGPPSATR
jgi:cytochrome c-type biogenesis protein CcmH/NrfG